MAEETTSKQQQEQENYTQDTEIDIISSLPDSLLLHILSFLPTETSVATMSLLSRRWRHLWKDLQVFDFDDYYDYDDDRSQYKVFRTFADFVNAVLILRRFRDIQKMSLSCTHLAFDEFFFPSFYEFDYIKKSFYEFEVHSIDTWIHAAIGPHLEEFYLALFAVGGADGGIYGFSFPLTLTIFSICTSLSTLSLRGNISLQLEKCSKIFLPSLKKLQLHISHEDVLVNILLSACPILETLEISLCPIFFATKLHVPSSLKHLEFTIVENSKWFFDQWTYLQIDAPDLNYLSLTNIKIQPDYTFGNLHNVVEAYLDVFSESECVDPLLSLLQAIHRVKHLVLHSSTTKWLFGGNVNDFPEFHRLLYLEIILSDFNLLFLFDVLQKCPMLQTLIIQNDKEPSSSPFNGYKVQPESVPNCLEFHLVFVHLKGYQQGHLDQLHFVEYVLRNGLVLKTMLISSLSSNPTEKSEISSIVTSFSDIPRGSVSCQFKFA